MPRRRLSPEERRLWEQVAKTTVPLHVAPAEPAAAEGAPPPAPAGPDRPAARSAPGPAPAGDGPRVSYEPPSDPHAWLRRATPHMDRRRFERLARGKFDPEARLDLHGMTADAAHAALTGFILSAHARDLRLVLVITGKGKAPDTERHPRRHGILRHSVPHWLAGPPLASRILQVTPAHQRHGGDGALYVYLRRRR